MTTPIIITCIVIAFLMFALYRELLRPVLVFMFAIGLLLMTGIIDSKDALAGFANEQIAVVFLLLMISDIIKKTAILDITILKVFHGNLSYKNFMARMMTSVSFISAWVNNTPLVAIMLPYVYDWSKKKGISPSKVLIPLSYATIIGGMATLIGTSTNLVVNGLAEEAAKKNHDIVPLGIFDFSPVGVPLIIIGIIYILFIGHRLLPSRKDPLKDFEEKAREYLVETKVPETSEFIGKTIEANLRNLKSLYLVGIVRTEIHITPVPRHELVQKDDILIFAGATEQILDLVKDPKQLSLPDFSDVPDHERTEVVEVVISGNSSLLGKVVRNTSFRGNYDAAIVAIKRDGERIQGSIGETKLQSGDLLLLIAGKDFKDRTRNIQDFYVISKVKEIRKIESWKTIIMIAGTISAFIVSAVLNVALFKTLLILLCVLALIRVVRFEEIKNSLDIDLLVILALALGIGKAIVNSGADKLFAGWIINTVEPFHSPVVALLGIYLITNVLAMLVTNKAAVAITFPIAMAMVQKLQMSGVLNSAGGSISYTPFILAVAYAGCAEFITPFGYQTNLMVYGPGGYKFKDYVRIGTPLTIIYMFTAVAILGYMYHLY